MNTIMAKLGAWGCDISGAMERMCDDKDFYISCLQDVAEDTNFETLKIKLDEADIQGAFDAAHTLKGVFANMGLTPMFNKVVEIVEPLRAGSKENMSVKYNQLIDMKKYLEDILGMDRNEAEK